MADILILDHNRLTRTILRTILGAAGYALVETDNCEDGLDLVLRHQPRVVLVELQLPRLDGLTFAQRMRQLPFIAQPELMFLSDRVPGHPIDVGQRAPITTPIAADHLLARIAELLPRPAARPALHEYAVGE
ncbi:MAG TPA: response regulator [Herpetosiphonaceae bacterium]|nr:response regulator [Herpetosiphonaceae bacterium]